MEIPNPCQVFCKFLRSMEYATGKTFVFMGIRILTKSMACPSPPRSHCIWGFWAILDCCRSKAI